MTTAAQNTLFNIEDYTLDGVKIIMQGHTCRECSNRICITQGLDQHVKVFVCKARESKLSKSGLLRVKANQPACILFTSKTK